MASLPKSLDGALVTVHHADFSGFSPTQIDLITRTIAKDCSPDELALFLEVCRSTGLDPFRRQIYAIKRGGQMTIQTGIDGYRLLAARTGELAGIDDPVYDADDADHPGRASVTVWRWSHGQRVPYTATARWKEYQQPGGNWGKMPYLMLGKCAEALALRRAFPAELSGVYTADEMSQGGPADEPTPTAYVDTSAADDPRIARALVVPAIKSLLVKLDYREGADQAAKLADLFDRFDGEGVTPNPRVLREALEAELAELTATPASLEGLPVGTRGN